MRIYVAGPMRGIPAFNFPAFDEAAACLRGLGHDVFNPADKDRETHGAEFGTDNHTGDEGAAAEQGFNLRHALGADLDYITQDADAVAVLDGWETSKGARAEVATAHALGLFVAPVNAFGHAWDGDDDGRPLAESLIHPAEPAPARIVLPASGEVRTTSSTGGEKGVKPARFDLIPAGPLWQLAELYGKGAEKYADRNWERGYEWSKSFGALQRHAWLFWQGVDLDEGEGGTGMPHLASVAWHAFALMEWATTHPEFDNRPGTGAQSVLEAKLRAALKDYRPIWIAE